jgi:hypothetical protein
MYLYGRDRKAFFRTFYVENSVYWYPHRRGSKRGEKLYSVVLPGVFLKGIAAKVLVIFSSSGILFIPQPYPFCFPSSVLLGISGNVKCSYLGLSYDFRPVIFYSLHNTVLLSLFQGNYFVTL